MSKFPYVAPTIRKAKGETLERPWYVEYKAWSESQNELKRKRVTLTQKTKSARMSEGRRLCNEILELLKSGATVDDGTTNQKEEAAIQRKDSVLAALKIYLQNYKKYVADSTFLGARTHLRRLMIHLNRSSYPNISLINFGTTEAYAFADDLIGEGFDISNRTRNNNIEELITVFNSFLKRKLIKENPFHGMSMLPAPAKGHTAFRDHQALKFQAACEFKDPVLWLFTQFIYYAALRPSRELRFLKISDIYASSIQVPSANAKNARKEHVAIPEELERLIQLHKLRNYDPDFYVFGREGEPGPVPLQKNNIWQRHHAILKETGLNNRDIDTYSWKHTGALALWRDTQNLELIRQHFRHKNLVTTTTYMRDLGAFVKSGQILKMSKPGQAPIL